MDRKNSGNLIAFSSWSGGKESTLSLYLAKLSGVKVPYLLNMTEESGRFSRSHGVCLRLLELQAESVGALLLFSETSWEEYEQKFRKKIFQLRKEGINAGIFGDIDLQEHREWVERICSKEGIKSIFPLWGEERERLLRKFINLGFKAIVVSVCRNFLDESFLGRLIDEDFIRDLKSRGVDLCGERGEYHTFVFDGPFFKKKVRFKTGRKISRDSYLFLEIKC
ncbi:diphthine--ammonia ligase [Candidatus Aerophobetes bacterium]|nr:diphthine--ammonia ligase [Candidatus Aerophobetes bacterium]